MSRTLAINGITIEEVPTSSTEFLLWRNHEQALSNIEIRQSVVNKQNSNGIVVSEQYYGARTIACAVEVFASCDRIRTLQQEISTALSLGQYTATIDNNRTIDVYVVEAPRFTSTNNKQIVLCEFVLRAADPYFYETTGTTLNGTEQAVTTGYTIQDAALPALPSQIQEVLQESFTANPTTATQPEFTVTGEVISPRIINITTGQGLEFTNNGGLTLGATETLTVNTRTRTATVDGTDVTAYLSVNSSWFGLNAGSNEVTLYDSDGTSLVGQLSLTYYERYI